MISLLKGEMPTLSSSPAAVRILSLYETYGCEYGFLRFYVQTIDGVLTAVISIMDGNATLLELNNADRHETTCFLSAVGAKTVFSENALPLEKQEVGDVMLFENNTDNKQPQNEIKLQSIYNVMSTCFDMPNFDAWYPDMSHRLRHGGAVAVQNEHGCAVAFKSRTDAIISGICVENGKRSQGYGSAILNELINISGVRKIYALVEENGPKQFYEKNGFSHVGKFSTFKVN